VDPDDLPDAEDLWWSWVVLAALHRAVGNDACRFHHADHLLTLDSHDGWLRMQRTHGSRAVLWGGSERALPSPPDPRKGAPDWALSDATDERRPTFLAWYAHGEWDASAPSDDAGAIHLLRPLLTVDPRVVELGRQGRLTPDQLATYANGEDLEEAAEIARLASAAAPPTSRGSVLARLRDQIHDQMRDTPDVDRELMQRPPILVQWLRASGPGHPFEYAVSVLRGQITPSPLNSRLPAHVVPSLTNVIRTLHSEEAGEDSGAWLFARVISDGVVVRFDRAFDGWPPWYRVQRTGEGPSLEDLAWEMRQRTQPWRPAWASLLPEGAWPAPRR
jgi:hypothetical protein